MTAIYNEIDPFAAQWLRNLIAAEHIADGVVDERSISDLVPADVAGLGQRHFFAGIAGWSLALRLAGVPDDADVWTGSCPCQPLSDAGRRRGFDDERHLWPAWFRLIAQCRPPVVFGEQVASSLGRTWLDLVFADLEGAGYACAAADLPAAGVGAPHRRQRLFFVAYADGQPGRLLAAQRQPGRADAQAERSREALGLADTDGRGWDGRPGHVPPRREQPDAARGGEARVADAQETGRGARRLSGPHGRPSLEPLRHGDDCRVADAHDPGLEVVGEQQARAERPAAERGGEVVWRGCDWIPCSDGVSRPIEPGTHPLAHGVPARVGKLRAYGNAIVPQVAAAFIRAALDFADGNHNGHQNVSAPDSSSEDPTIRNRKMIARPDEE